MKGEESQMPGRRVTTWIELHIPRYRQGTRSFWQRKRKVKRRQERQWRRRELGDGLD